MRFGGGCLRFCKIRDCSVTVRQLLGCFAPRKQRCEEQKKGPITEVTGPDRSQPDGQQVSPSSSGSSPIGRAARPLPQTSPSRIASRSSTSWLPISRPRFFSRLLRRRQQPYNPPATIRGVSHISGDIRKGAFPPGTEGVFCNTKY